MTPQQQVSIVDFGLAAPCGEPGVEGGTAGFASPEQLSGASSAKTQDVYSLGATALAWGTWSEELTALWKRCLAKDSSERPSLEEIEEGIKAL